MKKPLALALATATVLLLAAAPASAAVRTVKVGDNVFSPRTMTVNRGDTVRFRWVGDGLHNVVRTSGPSFRTIGFRRSGTVSRTLTRRGTLRLACTVHLPGMRLTITVR